MDRRLLLSCALVLGPACDAGPLTEEAPTSTSLDASTGLEPPLVSTSGGTSFSSSSSSSADPSDDPGASTDAMESSGDSGSTGGGSIACPAASLPPGRYNGLTLEHAGRTRTYDLYIPPTVDVTAPTPLVLNFHGLYGNPAQQAMFSQYDAAAEAAGVIVAYPAGLSNSWNTGLCCGGAQEDGVDDVGFARAAVEHISEGSCIDPARVFAIGMSNGGHMAHRLACEAADLFAGVASVTGVLTMLSCTPSRPISVQQFHGTADAIVRYDGYGPGYPPVEGMMADWASRNGCAPVPNVTHEQGDARCETWIGCENDVEVTLCSVEGGGHCWFGNPSCTFGASTTDVSANDVIARMLDTQSLPD